MASSVLLVVTDLAKHVSLYDIIFFEGGPHVSDFFLGWMREPDFPFTIDEQLHAHIHTCGICSVVNASYMEGRMTSEELLEMLGSRIAALLAEVLRPS